MQNLNIEELLEDYYAKKPDATIREFAADIKLRRLKEYEQEEKTKNWYKSLVGKFFVLQKTYIRVYATESGDLYTEQYIVDVDENCVMICHYPNYTFYTDWFNNPYIKHTDRTKFAVEISKETFDKVVKKYDEIQRNITKFTWEIQR